MRNRNIQFTELNNAFLAWFSQEHTRFVMNITSGSWKGCVLVVTPEPNLDVKGLLRHTTKNPDGTILARYEKEMPSTGWLLEDYLDKVIVDEIVNRLQGKSMDVPIGGPVENI